MGAQHDRARMVEQAVVGDSAVTTITLSEYARRVGISAARAWVWAHTGRIDGAVRVAGRWQVPAGATRPASRQTGRPRGSRTRNKP